MRSPPSRAPTPKLKIKTAVKVLITNSVTILFFDKTSNDRKAIKSQRSIRTPLWNFTWPSDFNCTFSTAIWFYVKIVTPRVISLIWSTAVSMCVIICNKFPPCPNCPTHTCDVTFQSQNWTPRKCEKLQQMSEKVGTNHCKISKNEGRRFTIWDVMARNTTKDTINIKH